MITVLIFARKSAGESYVPPIGIMSLAAVLRRDNLSDVHLFDMAVHRTDEIVAQCIALRPQVIGLSSDTISFEAGSALVDTIRSSGVNAPLIIGGVHASIAPEEALRRTNAVLAVIGEGEATITEVVRRIENPANNWASVRGIAYLRDNALVATEPRDPIEDLDSLPFPARDLLPMEKYLRARPDIPMLYPTITVFASRGCKANCIYCQPVARTMFGKKMRHRSAATVVEELELLKKTYRFGGVYFTDDELLFNGEAWVRELCRQFIERRLRLKWSCQARVDQVQDEDLLKLMKRSGCYAIGFGVESGDLSILKYMRKGYTPAQIDRAFSLCRKIGIVTTCNLMVGTPGESAETIRSSIDMIRRVHPNLVRVSITTPTPGSDLYRQMEQEHRITITKLSDFDRWALSPIKLDHFTKDDIRDSIRKLLAAFYADFFKSFYQPHVFVANFYFIRLLLRRYAQLLKAPGRLIQDVLFYFNYFRFRRGRQV